MGRGGYLYTDDGGAWGSLSAAAHSAERGIAAELDAEDPRLWRYPLVRRTIVAASGGTGMSDTPWGVGDVEASVGFDLGRTEIRSFETRAYRISAGREDGTDRTVSARMLADHTLGRRADVRSALTFADIARDEVVDGEAREFGQRLFSAGLETVVRVLERPHGPVRSVRLSVGGAYDRGSTPRTGGLEPIGTIHDWGARVGASALLRDGGTMLHLGMSRRGRFPSLREAYSEALDRFAPNPDLRPEHLRSIEGGVTSRMEWPGSGEVQVVGFHNRLDGAIRRVTQPDGRRRRVNADELESTGVEVLLDQSVGPFGFGGTLTLQRVELFDPVNQVSSEPENVPERVGTAFIRAPILGGVSGTIELEHTGPQFCQDPDSGADVRLSGGNWLNAVIRWVGGARLRDRRMEAVAWVTNLNDTALFDQCGLPRSGRLFRLQLSVF